MRAQVPGLLHGQGFRVEQLDMLLVDLRRLDGHRAVHVDGKPRQGLALEGAGQEVQQQLSTADGEHGDQDLAPGLDRLADNFPGLDGRLVQGAVIAVAVGGFHEHEVRVFERHGVAVQRCAAGA
jgi:hypothetical protein